MPIFAESKAMQKKPYIPGQHGPRLRRRVTDYSMGLNEKQKLRFMFGLSEKQFRLTFERAKRQRGVTGEIFMRLLELRLDNVIYQLGFARSVDPILPQEVTITRVAITTEADAEKKGTEMGRKYIVPYGLYRVEGYISANLARKTTGFSEDDLNLLWTAILNMFENDRSAARGMMAVRKLIIFKHDSELGNAPAWKLFKLVDVKCKPEIAAPRSFENYQFHVDIDHLPQGVTCQIME